MKKIINSFIFAVLFLTTLSINASQELNGIWVLDTDSTIESLSSKNSEFLAGAKSCYKDQLCFGTLFYFNKDSIYAFYPNEIDSQEINYILFGPYKYSIYGVGNNREIHYDINGTNQKIGFELQNEYLIMKQKNFDEFYKLASRKKVEELSLKLEIPHINKGK